MAKVKILARHLNPEVNTGTTIAPVWVGVGGLNTLTFDTKVNETDDTDFDSDGWEEHKVTSRSRSISCAGFYKEDPTDGSQDAGQEFLITASDLIGYDSLVPFRITTPGGNVTEYQVSVDAKISGGGLNDNDGFTADLSVSGQPVYTPAS